MAASSERSRRAIWSRLHEIGGAGEQDTPSVLDESKAEGGAEMRFATAGRAEDQKIGALFQPAVAGAERHDLGLGDHGNGVEVEAVEGFSGWQPRLFQMTRDAPSGAFGQFVLGERGKE